MSETTANSSTHIPSPHREAAAWIYRGIWAWLVRWMRIPEYPPTLPSRPGQLHRSFQPARAYLSCRKFEFWVFFGFFDSALIGAWVLVLVLDPMVAAFLTAPLWALALVPPVLAYVALHLRYDTQWYVMTDRSLRIRRGIWSLHEVTITFENVQTVKVTQGPLQRWFGIGNVEVQTAGGGVRPDPNGGHTAGMGHRGLIEGVADAKEIRDLILNQLRLSRTTGIGDESHAQKTATTFVLPSNGVSIRPEHLAILREIREALRT